MKYDPLSDDLTSPRAVVLDIPPNAHALSHDYDALGWLRNLDLSVLQLALIISIATCSIVMLSILCVTLARISYRRQRLQKPTRRSSVPAADLTFWSNPEHINATGKPDVPHGDALITAGLPLPLDADSGSDDIMASGEFGNDQVDH